MNAGNPLPEGEAFRVLPLGAVRRARIQAKEKPRRKSGQDSEAEPEIVVVLNPIVFCIRNGDRSVVALRPVELGLHRGILEGLIVPRAGPMIGRYVDLAPTLEAGEDSFVRCSFGIRCRDGQCRTCFGLEDPDHGLERDDDSDVKDDGDSDSFDEFQNGTPWQWDYRRFQV